MPNIPGQQMQLPGMPLPAVQQPSGWRQAGRRLWQTITLLWANREDAVDAYHWVNRWLRYAIIAALFELALATAVAAGTEAIWLKALIGIGLPALTLLVPLIIWPAILSTAWAIPRARRVLQGIITLVAIQSVYGVYLIVVPVHNEPGLLVATVALMWVAVLLIPAATGRSLARMIQTVLLVIVAFFTIAFYAGGTDGVRQKIEAIGGNDAKAAPTEVAPSGATTSRVTLNGFKKCSAEVDLDVGPRGENIFLGSDTVIVRWLDYGNEEGSINKDWGVRGGRVCFLGPAGESVTVRQVPNN